MGLQLGEVFDEYPNPLYIVRPIVEKEVSEDFEYIYVNQAFCIFIGRNRNELTGHSFLECFKQEGERQWLDLFLDTSKGQNHRYTENVSRIINKLMYTEVFHIEPDLCGCIIHDFKNISDDMQFQDETSLHYKANRDSLTGFYNRHYLNEVFDNMEDKEKIGVAYLDINNLKKINDSAGHTAGDERILQISEMMRDYYKDGMIFRLGGDEFLIITIGMDQEMFLRISSEFRCALEEEKLAALGYNFYEKPENIWACIDQCDALMYKEKNRMKN